MDTTEYNALCTLANAIAYHIPGWTAETPAPQPDQYPPRIVYLGRNDGAGIALGYMRNKPGRVEVSGRYPHEASLREYPQITLSGLRQPEDLAQEITRRFLPSYLERWKEAQCQLISVRLAEVRVQYAAEVCAMAVGLPLEQIRYDGTPRIGATLYTPVGKLTVEWAGTVQLHSNSLQPTVALDILKRLMDAKAEEPQAETARHATLNVAR